jgi:DNA (cytosine-5)-methyltransferase 1
LRGERSGLKVAEPIIECPVAYDNYNKNFKKDGCIGTLGTNCGCSTDTGSFSVIDNFRIRKLTPKECFRLQGFLDDEINLDGLSNTQKYKLAGNGQSVNVVKKIFQEMFK